MKQFIGEEFDAEVSGVQAFGVFAALENGCEGLIRIELLTGDYYQYDEQHMALTGRHTGKRFTIGTPIRVKLIAASEVTGQIDFAPAEGALPVAEVPAMAPEDEPDLCAARQPRAAPPARQGPRRLAQREKAAHAQAAVESPFPAEARNARHGVFALEAEEVPRASRSWNATCAAASRARGGLAPSCQSPPLGDVCGCPRPQTNFIHILWKNLIAITSRRKSFAPDPGGGSAGDVRLMFVVYTKATLRPGAVRARDAPRTPLGWQPIPACRNGKRAADGRRHLLLRAQRVLKGIGMIGKKGKTAGVPLLVRPPRAAALPACEAQAHTSPCQGDLPGAHIAPYINERF